MPDSSPVVSIIVPTLREEANLRILIPRIAAAMKTSGRHYEILIMDDDSRDGTDLAVSELAKNFPVELIVRTGQRDLSLAVLEGLRRARGEYLVVMDADLSHPPEVIPQLLDALDKPGTDFALGSRFTQGGRTQDWTCFRALNSFVATLVCRPLTGPITDPMSGFFALRGETLERATALNPIGYKIGLELICQCRCQQVAEVPIVFQNRTRGESKLNLEQQSRYLLHLDRLYRTHRRGWGLFLRPILWTMLSALNILRPFQSSSKPSPVQPSSLV
jgi:dolichol-phosphate mannosyltransferase